MTLKPRLILLSLFSLIVTCPVTAMGDESQTPVLACPSKAALGQPFMVRLTADHPLEDLTITWMGKRVSPSVSTWNSRHIGLVLLGTDVLHHKPGPQTLEVRATSQGKQIRISRKIQVTAKTYPRQDLTLPPNMVTPPESVLNRIKAERKLTRAALKTQSHQRLWHLPLYRPVKGIVTSPYGVQRFLNGEPRNPHRGLDFRAATGTPIGAVAKGRVILVGDHYYAGKSVYIDHGNGVISMYFHMSEHKVKEGDTVNRGQTIGLAGSTGRSTASHLHLSVAVQGHFVDPTLLFSDQKDELLK